MTVSDFAASTPVPFPERDGPRVTDVLRSDDVPPPAQMLEEAFADLGDEPIDRARYFEQSFHQLEIERLWPRVWQMACHETQIPDVGDYVVYDIGDDSLLVTRTGDDEIRAFHNTCLHRGNCLRTSDGHADEFQCHYHGWTWRIDGSFDRAPCPWDFPGLAERDLRLPEAHVARWAGWVFVNVAEDPEPFSSYMENLDELAEGFHMADRCIEQHVCKVVAGNWKVCMEAFIESYHVSYSHPNITGFAGDYYSQYDIYPGVRHVSRMTVPFGVPSPSYAGDTDPRVVLSEGLRYPIPEGAPPGANVRQLVSIHKRQEYRQKSGVDLSDRSDSEMLDAIELYLFPNFVPWLGTGQPYAYRFRPNGHDPDTCLMDLYVMLPVEPGTTPPPAPETRYLDVDQTWTQDPELLSIGSVLDQDMPNVAGVQRGIKAGRTPSVVLATYQESRIRHFHRALDAYLGLR